VSVETKVTAGTTLVVVINTVDGGNCVVMVFVTAGMVIVDKIVLAGNWVVCQKD
jgi:hypothetical protein